jgi:hypothetical protein
MENNLDTQDDLRYVCRLKASHYCKSCEGWGRLYRLHRRNARWNLIKITCRDCAGTVKRRDPIRTY